MDLNGSWKRLDQLKCFEALRKEIMYYQKHIIDRGMNSDINGDGPKMFRSHLDEVCF